MRVDPQVNRQKYDTELERLNDQASLLQARGIFLLHSSTYPQVELFYAPRHFLRFLVPTPPPGHSPLPPNTMAGIEFPSLAARSFLARFDLADYDLVPPSIEFFDPWTGATLPYGTMFRALEYEQQRGTHLVLLGDHPITHKPFLCVRGVREYHQHPQHSGDDWFLYRDSLSLFSLVISLWRVSIDIVRPQIVIQTNAGQVQLVAQWAADVKA